VGVARNDDRLKGVRNGDYQKRKSGESCDCAHEGKSRVEGLLLTVAGIGLVARGPFVGNRKLAACAEAGQP
jgi:hypothetical protein